jgi:hypothetical protein
VTIKIDALVFKIYSDYIQVVLRPKQASLLFAGARGDNAEPNVASFDVTSCTDSSTLVYKALLSIQ